MNKYFVGIVSILICVLFIWLFRWAFVEDQNIKKAEYATCLEQGCSESECKVFVTFPGHVKLNCPNGEISRD